jgi:hypothetical protein
MAIRMNDRMAAAPAAALDVFFVSQVHASSCSNEFASSMISDGAGRFATAAEKYNWC